MSAEVKKNPQISELNVPLWKANIFFTVLFLMNALDIIDRFALATALPFLKSTYGLTDVQAGSLSSALSLAVAIFTVPTGMLAYKWSRRKVLALMVGGWSIATWGTGLANGFSSLFAARFSVGIGEAAYAPMGYTFISAWYPEQMRARLIALFATGVVVGSSAGLALTGWLATSFGWRAMFGLLCIPGLILAVIAWYMPDWKNPPKAKKGESPSENEVSYGTGILDCLKFSFKSPAIIGTYLMAGTSYITSAAITLWAMQIFIRSFGMTVMQAAAFMGLTAIVSLFVPTLIGWCADVLNKKYILGKAYAAIIVALTVLILMGLFTLNANGAKNLVIAYITLAFVQGLQINGYAIPSTMTTELTPTHYRSLTSSFLPLATQGIGGICGPLIAGFISDKTGNLNTSIFIVTCIGTCLMLISTWLVTKYFKRDRERLKDMPKVDLVGI